MKYITTYITEKLHVKKGMMNSASNTLCEVNNAICKYFDDKHPNKSFEIKYTSDDVHIGQKFNNIKNLDITNIKSLKDLKSIFILFDDSDFKAAQIEEELWDIIDNIVPLLSYNIFDTTVDGKMKGYRKYNKNDKNQMRIIFFDIINIKDNAED